jgi:hypothetical protein
MTRFRSKSERITNDFLKDKKVSFKFEPYFIKYNGIVLEVKGRFTLDDRKKHLFLRKSNPDLDVRFVFNNPNSKLYKGAKSTYADWCSKHGFLFCKLSDGIPEGWISGKRRNKTSSRDRGNNKKKKS